jgi:hypothetical protein
MYICQPLGSVLSGIVLERLGRKKSMILVNFPHLIGWFIFYFATSVPMMYFSAVIMGLGIGFMEAPIITYVGEISQPEMRGILTSYSGKAAQCHNHYLPPVSKCRLFTEYHGVLLPGEKRLVREANHSPLCIAEAKNERSHTSAPTTCLYGIHGDNLQFIFRAR